MRRPRVGKPDTTQQLQDCCRHLRRLSKELATYPSGWARHHDRAEAIVKLRRVINSLECLKDPVALRRQRSA